MPPRDLSSLAEAIGEAPLQPHRQPPQDAQTALMQQAIDRYYREREEARKATSQEGSTE